MSVIKELKLFAKDLSILIAEDNKELKDELSSILSIFFKKTESTIDGKEALERYKEEKFDIILSDITMPEINGVTLAREIKNIKRDQSIIILSAHTELVYLIDLIDIGVDQFIAKPFKRDDLLYKILKVCENIVHKNHFDKNLSSSSNTTIPQKIKEVIEEEINLNEDYNLSEDEDIGMFVNHEQITSKDFIKELQNDKLVWDSLENQISELIELKDEFEEQINILNLGRVDEEVISPIIKILYKIENIFTFIDGLSSLSAVINNLSNFLENLDVESLDYEQKNKLKILEFVYEDISRFIETVFIYQDTLDVHYLEDSLKASIEQLKFNMINQNIDEEELELF